MTAKRHSKSMTGRASEAAGAATIRSSQARAPTPAPHAVRMWEHARLNSRFTFLIYAAVAIGTVPLDATLRSTILWVILALLVLAHVASQPLAMRYERASIQRGLLLGVLLTLPLAFLARDVLLTLATLSLGTSAGLLLFQRMTFLAAPLEELYYRGCVQRDHGALEATLFYTLGAFIMYWPITQGFWLVLGTMTLGSALLGMLWAWLNKRYGLSAAIACHIACNLCLFVVPSLLRDYGHLVF